MIPFFNKFVVIYSSKYKTKEFDKFVYILNKLKEKSKFEKEEFIDIIKLIFDLNTMGKGKTRKRNYRKL